MLSIAEGTRTGAACQIFHRRVTVFEKRKEELYKGKVAIRLEIQSRLPREACTWYRLEPIKINSGILGLYEKGLSVV